MKVLGWLLVLCMGIVLESDQLCQQSELLPYCSKRSAEYNIALCKGIDSLLPVPKYHYTSDYVNTGCLMPAVSFSWGGAKASCNNNALGIFLIAIDVVCWLKKRKKYKQYIQGLSDDDLTEQFPHLEMLNCHIYRIQKMLELSKVGTFPEKITARIFLVQGSLCHPYGKVLESCAKKLYRLSFDHQSKFTFKEEDVAGISYKEFYKKIPQDKKQLMSNINKVPCLIDNRYNSSLFKKVNNEYNQTLLDIIDVGLEENFPRLKKLCKKYCDRLMQRLYQYYIDQKVERCHTEYGAYQAADVDPIIQDLPVEQQQAVAKEISEELILREFYKQELTSWLLQENQKENIDTQYKLLSTHKKSSELPLFEHYRFILLKNFIEKTCKGLETPEELYKEFFCAKGVLKKYAHSCFVKEKLKHGSLDDPLFHKAVNYSLAIVDKERDPLTLKLSEIILQLVIKLTQSNMNEEVSMHYKEKVVFLYNTLSSGQYDEKLLDI